jgi:hypothetical protein
MSTPGSSALEARRCVPCRGGTPPLRGEPLAALLAELGGDWRVVDGHHLAKEFRFRDFGSLVSLGELFELHNIRPLNYIIGPLGSGKTRLAARLAEALPNARFIGLDRLADNAAMARARLDEDTALKSRVEQSLSWIIEDGAQRSPALIALLVALETEGPDILVIDTVEQDLDQATQEAVISHLRLRAPDGQG